MRFHSKRIRLRLRQLWRLIAGPTSSTARERHRNTRILVSLMAASLGMEFGGLDVTLAPERSKQMIVAVLCIALLFIGGAYRLGRKGHYTLAAGIAIFTYLIGTYISVVIVQNESFELGFLCFGVLVSGLFLSIRETVLTLLVSVIGILCLPSLVRGVNYVESGVGAFFVLSIAAFAFAATAIQRQDRNLIERKSRGLTLELAERTRIEKELRKSEARFRDLVENTTDWIWEVDSNFAFSYSSPLVRELLGYEPSQILGKSHADFMAAEEAPRFWPVAGPTLQERKPFKNLQSDNRHKDGRLIALESSGVPVYDDRERFCGYRGIHRDITERKRAENALKESEERYRVLAETAQDAIFIINRNGRIGYVNRYAAGLLGMTPDDLVDKDLDGILPPLLLEREMRGLKQVLESAKPVSGEAEFGFPTKQAWMNAQLLPLLTEDGQVRAVMGIARDITERKLAEEQQERLVRELRATRERLLALSERLVETQELERRQISQELHDQVGGNLAALSINMNIVRSQVPADAVPAVGTRLDACLDLVDETVACIRDMMAELRPSVLDDYGLIAALDWPAGRFYERTGVPVQIQGAELSPPLESGKEIALFRIAQEALNNVSKHAHAGRASITAEDAGEIVHLSIADDGIGFDVAAPRRTGPQRSWGLTLMRERARSVGGDLRVFAAPGKGTKIVVDIPR